MDDKKRRPTAASKESLVKRPRGEGVEESNVSTKNGFGANQCFAPIRQFRTRNQDAPLKNSCFCMSLRQVLGFDGNLLDASIEWLVIANYLIDPEFLLQEVPELLSVGCTVVFYGHQDASFNGWKHAVGTDAIDFKCLRPSEPPGPMNPTTHKIPYGVHHTKMFLVGFSNQTLRVVVHTANLRYSDIHLKAQGLYFQDFPLKKSDATSRPQPSDFENTLLDYLDTYRYTQPRIWTPGGEPEFLRSVVRRYDYSSACVVLIPSTPGYHRLDAKELRGHLKVRHAITQYAAPASKGTTALTQNHQPIVCQFSSIGSLSEKYLRELQSSFDVQRARPQQTQATGKDTSPIHIKIVYPTVQEIRGSLEGYEGGGSVPGTQKNVSKPFLRPLFHRWNATGSAAAGQKQNPLWKPNNVPHIKTYFQLSKDRKSLEYFVLGSQNLSMAAWGNLQNDSRSGGRRLFIRHWELGVFLSPQLMGCDHLVPWCPDVSEAHDSTAIPLPFCHVPERYGPSDEPWAVDVRYRQPDKFGRYSVQD